MWVRLATGAAALVLVALIGVVAWRQWPSGPGATSVVIVNNSRLRIERVYVFQDGPQGMDRLGRGTLPVGLGMRIQLKDAVGCRFNVQVVYSDGPPETKNGLDLCRTPEVVFSGS
jgi:hypothetical protein